MRLQRDASARGTTLLHNQAIALRGACTPPPLYGGKTVFAYLDFSKAALRRVRRDPSFALHRTANLCTRACGYYSASLHLLFTKSFCRQNLFREDFFLVVKTLNARNKFALAFFRRHLFSLLIAAYIFYACATLTRGPPRCIACRKYSRKTFANKTFP